MGMILGVFLACWLTLTIAPDTPIGQALTRWMVVRPAARIAAIRPGQVLLVLLLALGAATIGWTVGHEGARLIAMGLPELATWITMFEVTAYLDALAAIVTTASLTRIAGVKAWVRAILPPRRATPRAPRRSPPAGGRAPANDDDGPARYAIAA